MAWGKEKHNFYNTDENDYKFKERARALHIEEVNRKVTAELEAYSEHQLKHKEKLAGIDEMELLNSAAAASKPQASISTQKEHSSLKKRKIQSLQFNQENPEFAPLMENMEVRSKECTEYLEPILDAEAQGKISSCPALDYVRCRYRVCQHYIQVVLAYGMLITEIGEKVKSHPVMKKLATYRLIFKNLEKLEECMKPVIVDLVYRMKHDMPLKLLYPPGSEPMDDSFVFDQPEEDQSDEDGEEEEQMGMFVGSLFYWIEIFLLRKSTGKNCSIMYESSIIEDFSVFSYLHFFSAL